MPPLNVSTSRWITAVQSISLIHLSDEDQSLLTKPLISSISPRSQLLKINSRTCFDFDCVDSGPRDRIRCLRCHHLACICETPQELHPTQRKKMGIASIKDRGAVSICVTAPIYLPRPTNPWALHLLTPWHVAPLPGIRVDLHGLLPRVPATCTSCGPCAALPRVLSPTSHPRWSHAPRQCPCHVSSVGSME